MILLALTVLATLCTLCMGLGIFALVLAHKGNWNKAYGAVLCYPVPVLVVLWVLYASTP